VTPDNVVDLINEVYESKGIEKNTDLQFFEGGECRPHQKNIIKSLVAD